VFNPPNLGVPRMTWTRLRAAFHLPVYRVSIGVLLIVPLVSRVIDSEKFEILLGNAHLPTTLALSYVAAVFVILTRFVYDFFCPRIIRDYISFRDFIDQQALPQAELLRYLTSEQFILNLGGKGQGFLWWRPAFPIALEGLNWIELRNRLKASLSAIPESARDDDIAAAYELIVRTGENANPLALVVTYCLMILAATFVVAIFGIQLFTVVRAVF
jgi:hypothetical protein